MLADETTPHKCVLYSLITIDVFNAAHLISLLAYKDYFWINCQQSLMNLHLLSEALHLFF